MFEGRAGLEDNRWDWTAIRGRGAGGEALAGACGDLIGGAELKDAVREAVDSVMEGAADGPEIGRGTTETSGLEIIGT